MAELNEQDKFKILLLELGLSKKDLARELDLQESSVISQLNSKAKLPRWAKAMLLVRKLIEK